MDDKGDRQLFGRDFGQKEYTMKECEKYCKNKAGATGCEYNKKIEACLAHTEPLGGISVHGQSGYFCNVFKEGQLVMC